METTTNEVIPADLIGVTQAVRLIPGRRPGRSIHQATLRRWLDRGWLRAYWVGGLLKVSVAELRQLVRVREPRRKRGEPKGKPGMTRAQEERFTRETLERFGVPSPEG